MVSFSPAIIKLRMRENGVFLVPVKYTLVCRAPALAVLGRTTHYHVSCILLLFPCYSCILTGSVISSRVNSAIKSAQTACLCNLKRKDIGNLSCLS